MNVGFASQSLECRMPVSHKMLMATIPMGSSGGSDLASDGMLILVSAWPLSLATSQPNGSPEDRLMHMVLIHCIRCAAGKRSFLLDGCIAGYSAYASAAKVAEGRGATTSQVLKHLAPCEDFAAEAVHLPRIFKGPPIGCLVGV